MNAIDLEVATALDANQWPRDCRRPPMLLTQCEDQSPGCLPAAGSSGTNKHKEEVV